MAGSITEFTSIFQGGARSNRYRITIPQLGDNLQFLAKAANLPGSNVAAVDVPYMGRIVKVAGDRTFDDWTISVFNDVDFKIRNSALMWLSALENSHVANAGPDMPMVYYREVTVEQLNRNNNVIQTIIIHDAFPTAVGEITLGFDQNDQIEEFDITFAYNFWTGDSVE